MIWNDAVNWALTYQSSLVAGAGNTIRYQSGSRPPTPLLHELPHTVSSQRMVPNSGKGAVGSPAQPSLKRFVVSAGPISLSGTSPPTQIMSQAA